MDYNDMISTANVVLVEFFATWCPHCRRMAPIVEQVSELVEGRAKVYQLDIDRNQEYADEQNVQSVPTFILYRNSTEVWRHSGEIEANDLLAKVEEYMK